MTRFIPGADVRRLAPMVRFVVVCGALVGLTLIGEAADPPKGKAADDGDLEKQIDDVFRRMDANKDGKISRDEAKARIAENFDRIDRNKDGFIDRDELRQMLRTFQA